MVENGDIKPDYVVIPAGEDGFERKIEVLYFDDKGGLLLGRDEDGYVVGPEGDRLDSLEIQALVSLGALGD